MRGGVRWWKWEMEDRNGKCKKRCKKDSLTKTDITKKI